MQRETNAAKNECLSSGRWPTSDAHFVFAWRSCPRTCRSRRPWNSPSSRFKSTASAHSASPQRLLPALRQFSILAVPRCGYPPPQNKIASTFFRAVADNPQGGVYFGGVHFLGLLLQNRPKRGSKNRSKRVIFFAN